MLTMRLCNYEGSMVMRRPGIVSQCSYYTLQISMAGDNTSMFAFVRMRCGLIENLYGDAASDVEVLYLCLSANLYVHDSFMSSAVGKTQRRVLHRRLKGCLQ